jgi:hypothetical protein
LVSLASHLPTAQSDKGKHPLSAEICRLFNKNRCRFPKFHYHQEYTLATIMCGRNAEMDLSNIMSPSPGADCHPDIIDRTWGLKKGGAYFPDDTVIQYSITIMHISRPKKLKASSVVDRLLMKSQSSYMNYCYTYTLIFLK